MTIGLFTALLSMYTYILLPNHKNLEVSFLDIGQGDAIYVKAPNGNSILIDGGPPGGSVSSKISETTDVFDKHIDVIMGTHADADHIGGFYDVLQNYSASLYIDPHFSSNTIIYKKLTDLIYEKKIEKITARKGIQVILDSDKKVELEILYPSNSYPVYMYNECEKNKKGKRKKKCEKNLQVETNQTSIVARLKFGNKSFLFTGDAPLSVEDFLMSTIDRKEIQSNVLKVGHHGSKTSTSEKFLSIVKPEYAVISSGRKNRYGHPHKDVLNVLKNTKVFRTDELGTIKIISDGDSLDIK